MCIRDRYMGIEIIFISDLSLRIRKRLGWRAAEQLSSWNCEDTFGYFAYYHQDQKGCLWNVRNGKWIKRYDLRGLQSTLKRTGKMFEWQKFTNNRITVSCAFTGNILSQVPALGKVNSVQPSDDGRWIAVKTDNRIAIIKTQDMIIEREIDVGSQEYCFLNDTSFVYCDSKCFIHFALPQQSFFFFAINLEVELSVLNKRTIRPPTNACMEILSLKTTNFASHVLLSLIHI
eukprot:TRINITY_DN9406_c0_g1_i1.p1 TRINITY_DN9406_c0_g1~~TRINITY_DN9406_c0_g1_i1.p1  ORF type:complete len:247 (-),score=20.07 TRINITY_DN9406_c0_g1_i1:60-752(-)